MSRKPVPIYEKPVEGEVSVLLWSQQDIDRAIASLTPETEVHDFSPPAPRAGKRVATTGDLFGEVA